MEHTLLDSEPAFVPHLRCKGVSVESVWVPCCPDSAPDDRDDVAAVSPNIGVTFSSLELSCQRWTRRRRLLRAAKEKVNIALPQPSDQDNPHPLSRAPPSKPTILDHSGNIPITHPVSLSDHSGPNPHQILTQ